MAATLSGATSVRLRGSLAASVQRVGDRVRISARGRAVTMPAEAEAALRELAAGGSVRVDALSGLDEESALVVARRLLREGFLVATE